ncbi:MAG TPA: ATPase, T2SS/T4P/T4SS family, partial [Candidatus Limnocylindria bacterium]|nr:ATPase, T2SS/T4P/T4SS family [Candidatus Limnocylindria bacterium]
MTLDNIPIKDILLKGHYIEAEDLKKAESYAQNHHTTLLEYLLSQNIITKQLIGQAIAESFALPYADLSVLPAGPEQVLKLPEALAKKYNLILFSETDSQVIIATSNPAQPNLAGLLRPMFPQKLIRLAYALPDEMESLFVSYLRPLLGRLQAIINEKKKVAPELIEEIFKDALVYRASDIHFEPHGEELVLRFRVDGVLREVARLPKDCYENILNRLKVQARLRTDEHFSPQDGSIQYQNGQDIVAMRVSIVPTLDGEKVVVRLLSAYIKSYNLADLGLSQKHLELVLDSAKKPFGMVLVTGPTGSGKTTTLYALLNAI